MFGEDTTIQTRSDIKICENYKKATKYMYEKYYFFN